MKDLEGRPDLMNPLRASEEKAQLLFSSFAKKTSVIYDIQTLCEFIKKDLSSIVDSFNCTDDEAE